jgi:hypothetical protein
MRLIFRFKPIYFDFQVSSLTIMVDVILIILSIRLNNLEYNPDLVYDV